MVTEEEKVNSKPKRVDKFAIGLVILALIIMFFIVLLLKMPISSYFFVILPLLFGLFFTALFYKKYGKFLKSSVDTILYFQTSIIATLSVIKTVVKKVPENLFADHIHTPYGFFYLYAMAIAAVTKCCVSYCDSKVYFKEENDKLIIEAAKNREENKKMSLERKAAIFFGTSLITLILLILK